MEGANFSDNHNPTLLPQVQRAPLRSDTAGRMKEPPSSLAGNFSSSSVEDQDTSEGFCKALPAPEAVVPPSAAGEETIPTSSEVRIAEGYDWLNVYRPCRGFGVSL